LLFERAFTTTRDSLAAGHLDVSDGQSESESESLQVLVTIGCDREVVV